MTGPEAAAGAVAVAVGVGARSPPAWAHGSVSEAWFQVACPSTKSRPRMLCRVSAPPEPAVWFSVRLAEVIRIPDRIAERSNESSARCVP